MSDLRPEMFEGSFTISLAEIEADAKLTPEERRAKIDLRLSESFRRNDEAVLQVLKRLFPPVVD